jgi:hypothetical protein
MALDKIVYSEAADEVEAKHLSRVMKASTKRGWNATFGESIKSIRDLTKDYNAKMKSINQMCVNAGHESLLEEEEVVVEVQRKG